MQFTPIDPKGCTMHRFTAVGDGFTAAPRSGGVDQRRHASCPGRRRALLVDLENMVRIPDPCSSIADWVPAEDALSFLRRAVAEAGEVDHALLAASAGVVTRYFDVVQALGIHCIPVDGTPDAADRALLERGDHLVRIGFSEFIVVSADHCFVQLAKRCDCTVIVRVGQDVASSLRNSARHVIAA